MLCQKTRHQKSLRYVKLQDTFAHFWCFVSGGSEMWFWPCVLFTSVNVENNKIKDDSMYTFTVVIDLF